MTGDGAMIGGTESLGAPRPDARSRFAATVNDLHVPHPMSPCLNFHAR